MRALLLVVALGGCSTAIYQDVRYDAGRAPALPGDVAALVGAPKSAVLGQLGPPAEILPQAGGDIFVYRLRHIDLDTLQINTGLFLPVAVPVYAQARGSRRDDVLFVFFDPQGRVREIADMPSEP